MSKKGAYEGNKNLPFSWDAIISEYEADLKFRNSSQKTVDWYEYVLKRLIDHLSEKKYVKPPSQIDTKELKEYITYLQQKAERWPKNKYIKSDHGKLSPYTVRGHVRAIKVFFNWLENEGYIDHNPAAKLPLPHVPQYIIETLTSDQIEKLLSLIDSHDPLGAKYYCILLTLLDSGMRISELVNIKLSDIDLVSSLIVVFGKGQKERVVPISKWTRKELSKYINKYRQYLCSEESAYLFPATNGDHISVSSVQQYFRRLAKKAGTGGIKLSPHILRHTFATQAVANEANLFTLKEIMGHSSLQTTLKYTHLKACDLKNQHSKFSPVANLMKNKS